MPAPLPALERELESRLLKLDELQRSRASLPNALARARAGQEIDVLLEDICELQQAIDAAPAVSLADAAVKLRRLNAHVGPGRASRLLGEALAAVERAAAG